MATSECFLSMAEVNSADPSNSVEHFQDNDELLELARQAGLCYPDCHFLDLEPSVELDAELRRRSPEEQEHYVAIVARELVERDKRIDALRLFAALAVISFLKKETAAKASHV
jgi:hypothetical protein